MQNLERAAWSWQQVRRRALLWALLAALTTAWALQFSLRHGRLLAPPTCDDVGYLLDGLCRLEDFRLHGCGAALIGLAVRPPHAPFSTILAAVCFGVLGVHEWAPYAGNGLIVFTVLGVVDWLLRGVRPWLRGLCLLLTCAIPLVHGVVREFRPDFAVALIVAAASLLLATNPLRTAGLRHKVAVGVLFGLALWIKPTMCVVTGVMLAASLMLASASDRLLQADRPSILGQLADWAVVVGTTALVASPYYLAAGAETARYIYDNIFGKDSARWKYHAGPGAHLRYYLTGLGEQLMLGWAGPALLALMLAGVGYAAWTRQARPAVRAGAVAGLLLVAYAVPTAAGVKHGFYGLTFYFLALFASVMSLRLLTTAPGPQPLLARGAAVLALCGGAAAGLFVPTDPQIWGSAGDGRLGDARRVQNDLVAILTGDPATPSPRVCLTRESYDWLSLAWLAAVEGRRIRFAVPNLHPCLAPSCATLKIADGDGAPTLGRWPDLDRYRREMERSDYVVAAAPEPAPQTDDEQLTAAALQTVRAMSAFVELRCVPAPDGGVYHVFKNAAFAGWRPLEGIDPPEGPFPQWDLPVVHWATGPRTRLAVAGADGGAARLGLTCRTDHPGQSLSISLDGVRVGDLPLPVSGAFTELDVPMALPKGEHELTIDYAVAVDRPPTGSVLYKRLQVLPAAGDSDTSSLIPSHK
jgi:hypothetical protein